jgi:hypothetical protein
VARFAATVDELKFAPAELDVATASRTPACCFWMKTQAVGITFPGRAD